MLNRLCGLKAVVLVGILMVHHVHGSAKSAQQLQRELQEANVPSDQYDPADIDEMRELLACLQLSNQEDDDPNHANDQPQQSQPEAQPESPVPRPAPEQSSDEKSTRSLTGSRTRSRSVSYSPLEYSDAREYSQDRERRERRALRIAERERQEKIEEAQRKRQRNLRAHQVEGSVLHLLHTLPRQLNDEQWRDTIFEAEQILERRYAPVQNGMRSQPERGAAARNSVAEQVVTAPQPAAGPAGPAPRGRTGPVRRTEPSTFLGHNRPVVGVSRSRSGSRESVSAGEAVPEQEDCCVTCVVS